MAAAAEAPAARRFARVGDVVRGAYFTDGERLLEVRQVNRSGKVRIEGQTYDRWVGARLVDCARPLPEDALEEAAEPGAWVPMGEIVGGLFAVVPSR
jgi:hypothetical protein